MPYDTNKNVRPVTPKEFRKKITKDIPPFVIEAINQLIMESPYGTHIKILREKIIERAVQITGYKIPETDFNHNEWINQTKILLLYKENGWDVEYQSPLYDEYFEPYFIFAYTK